MTEYYVAVCMTIKAENSKEAQTKVGTWMGKQDLPKWMLDHDVSEAQEASI